MGKTIQAYSIIPSSRVDPELVLAASAKGWRNIREYFDYLESLAGGVDPEINPAVAKLLFFRDWSKDSELMRSWAPLMVFSSPGMNIRRQALEIIDWQYEELIPALEAAVPEIPSNNESQIERLDVDSLRILYRLMSLLDKAHSDVSRVRVEDSERQDQLESYLLKMFAVLQEQGRQPILGSLTPVIDQLIFRLLSDRE